MKKNSIRLLLLCILVSTETLHAQNTVNVILKIVVHCIQQQDATGSDDIKVIRNNSDELGKLTLQSGQTDSIVPRRSISRSIDEQGFVIGPGDNIKIYEVDFLDKNDLLLDHNITADDISAGILSLPDSADDAEYTFTFYFQ